MLASHDNQRPLLIFGKGWIMQTSEEKLQEQEAWESAQYSQLRPISTRLEECITPEDVQLLNSVVPFLQGVDRIKQNLDPTLISKVVDCLIDLQ